MFTLTEGDRWPSGEKEEDAVPNGRFSMFSKENSTATGRGTVEASAGAKGTMTEEYRTILPHLPTGEMVKNSVVLHCDTGGRPYRAEDFVRPLQQAGVLSELAGLGAYQMGHVWLLKLKTPEAKEKLLQAGEIQVKGRRCLAIDPYRREVRVKLHWVTFDVPVDTVRRAFEPYGEVKSVVREMWKVDGLVGVESTTLSVVLTLRQDLTLESLPHQLRFYGGTVLVVVPGRAPVCLRCRRIGHIRRECRAPWCSECRGFGHESTDCTRRYARAVTVHNDGGGVNEELMDEVEAEEAASMAGDAKSEGAHGSNSQAPTEAPNTTDEERQGKSEAEQTSSTTQSSEDRTVPGSDTTKTSEGEKHDNDMDFNPAMIKRRHEGADAAVAGPGEQPRQSSQQEGDDVKNKKSRGGSPRRSSSLSQGSPPPQ
ncbi:hypothetical protein ISCGN_001462 [Ixodes scapularis]